MDGSRLNMRVQNPVYFLLTFDRVKPCKAVIDDGDQVFAVTALDFAVTIGKCFSQKLIELFRIHASTPVYCQLSRTWSMSLLYCDIAAANCV